MKLFEQFGIDLGYVVIGMAAVIIILFTMNIDEQLEYIDSRLIKAYQKVGLVKYDAFKEIGGKLSFVLVLLTADNDGFLINSMHSTNEGCYTYTKEIVNGEAFVILSEEEQQALEEAKTNSSPLFKKKI